MAKVLLITGASSGIGKTTALTAAKAGYKVILTARREELLDELVAEIGSDQALGVPADVSDFSALQTVVERGIDKFGQLDAVFANAGTAFQLPALKMVMPKSGRRWLMSTSTACSIPPD